MKIISKILEGNTNNPCKTWKGMCLGTLYLYLFLFEICHDVCRLTVGNFQYWLLEGGLDQDICVYKMLEDVFYRQGHGVVGFSLPEILIVILLVSWRKAKALTPIFKRNPKTERFKERLVKCTRLRKGTFRVCVVASLTFNWCSMLELKLGSKEIGVGDM